MSNVCITCESVDVVPMISKKVNKLTLPHKILFPVCSLCNVICFQLASWTALAQQMVCLEDSWYQLGVLKTFFLFIGGALHDWRRIHWSNITNTESGFWHIKFSKCIHMHLEMSKPFKKMQIEEIIYDFKRSNSILNRRQRTMGAIVWLCSRLLSRKSINAVRNFLQVPLIFLSAALFHFFQWYPLKHFCWQPPGFNATLLTVLLKANFSNMLHLAVTG